MREDQSSSINFFEGEGQGRAHWAKMGPLFSILGNGNCSVESKFKDQISFSHRKCFRGINRSVFAQCGEGSRR